MSEDIIVIAQIAVGGITASSSVLRRLAIPLMLLGGALISCQAAINGHLAREIGSGLRAPALASVISFGSGLVVLTVLMFLIPAGRRGVVRLLAGLRARRLRPVELIGGLCGAFFVASQSISVGTTGVAVFIAAFTAGQSTGSLALDRWGIVSARQPLNASRLLAVCLTIIAAGLGGAESVSSQPDVVLVMLLLLALGAGVLSALQQALNGRVAAVTGPVAATWSNFVVGTLALSAFLGAALTAPGAVNGLPSAWWPYLGGMLGVVFIGIATLTVHVHGVLVLALCTIAGQVVTSLIIDLLRPSVAVGALSATGAVLTLVGVVVAVASQVRVRRPAVA